MSEGSAHSVAILAKQAIAAVFRDRTMALLALLFMALSLVSAYLGWSATSTVNAIYFKAAGFLQSQGQPVPTNPVLDTSPLSLLRNMPTYIGLIGTLSAIVLGYQLIATDRKAGVLPLLGTRSFTHLHFAIAKIGALIIVISGLLIIAASINIATFLLIPQLTPKGADWVGLLQFYGASSLYMLFFGFLGLACSTTARSESVGLLIPVTVWLTMTFILPQITSNILPVAALNPVTALANPPSSTFFQLTGALLGPFSLAETYRILAAQFLQFLPPEYVIRSAINPLVSLLLAFVAGCAAALYALIRIDMAHGEYNA